MDDICVCCGEYVPEGRMVCPACEARYEPGARPMDCYGAIWELATMMRKGPRTRSKEAVTMAGAALRKAAPTEPRPPKGMQKLWSRRGHVFAGSCPGCGGRVWSDMHRYCPDCGQALYWPEDGELTDPWDGWEV